MRRIRVETSAGEELTFVLKSTKASRMEQSHHLGLAREAIFYKQFGEKYKKFLPEVYYTYGDMNCGNKYIILEDLSDGVQSGYFFGSGSPLNWGKDLDIARKGIEVPMENVVEHAIMVAARLHGPHWKKAELLHEDMSWLRGSEWQKGRGEESWQEGQAHALSCWEKTKLKMENEYYGVTWDPDIMWLMDASFNKTSWTDFQERIQSSSWTLVHGDFHPANMMWRPDEDDREAMLKAKLDRDWGHHLEGKHAEEDLHPHVHHPKHHHQLHNVVLLDWEVVGLGSGSQDLGQYFISHMTPRERRDCEEHMLRLYYSQLLSYGSVSWLKGKNKYTWEQCWDEYVSGGAERWVFLLAVLSATSPDDMVQYFHDQLKSFVSDHEVTPESIGMPRL